MNAQERQHQIRQADDDDTTNILSRHWSMNYESSVDRSNGGDILTTCEPHASWHGNMRHHDEQQPWHPHAQQSRPPAQPQSQGTQHNTRQIYNTHPFFMRMGNNSARNNVSPSNTTTMQSCSFTPRNTAIMTSSRCHHDDSYTKYVRGHNTLSTYRRLPWKTLVPAISCFMMMLASVGFLGYTTQAKIVGYAQSQTKSACEQITNEITKQVYTAKLIVSEAIQQVVYDMHVGARMSLNHTAYQNENDDLMSPHRLFLTPTPALHIFGTVNANDTTVPRCMLPSLEWCNVFNYAHEQSMDGNTTFWSKAIVEGMEQRVKRLDGAGEDAVCNNTSVAYGVVLTTTKRHSLIVPSILIIHPLYTTTTSFPDVVSQSSWCVHYATICSCRLPLRLWGVMAALLQLNVTHFVAAVDQHHHLEQEIWWHGKPQNTQNLTQTQLPPPLRLFASVAITPRNMVTALGSHLEYCDLPDSMAGIDWKVRAPHLIPIHTISGIALMCLASFVMSLGLLYLSITNARYNLILEEFVPRKHMKAVISGATVLERCDGVTVLFVDIVGYTRLCSELPPCRIVEMLNLLYKHFDALVGIHGCYKTDIIGDAFMCMAGCPDADEPAVAARRIANLAFDMLDIASWVGNHMSIDIKVRIGIHTGTVYGAIIGCRVPHYTPIGDAVNVASRMESHGMPCCVHISHDTATLLAGMQEFSIRPRTPAVNVKGKGVMQTYWLHQTQMFRSLTMKTDEGRLGEP